MLTPNKLIITIIVISILTIINPGYSMNEHNDFTIQLSNEADSLLNRNGFVITYNDVLDQKEPSSMYDIYTNAKKYSQPIFVTTDVILHTTHTFFDYLLRILEIEKLYDTTRQLTDKMLELSINQYNSAKDKEIKELARLNIGFFAVAKKQFDPEYKVGFDLDEIVDKEIKNINEHSGLAFRELLTYIENPSPENTPYAYEDYSQYVPRGHYTRNETFKKYFKVMMWYGRIDFKLKPGKDASAILYGKKMTLQAILITDAVSKDSTALNLWKAIYEPTTYFLGKTDDLYFKDYANLLNEVFPDVKKIDKYNDKKKLDIFIDKAIKLKQPKISSGTSFVEDGEFSALTQGFRFIGQRFIPDSYILQELVFGKKGENLILKYKGNKKPFTMENIPAVGPVRAFPRGLDVLAVLGSKRALEILEQDGDTEYNDYYEQLEKLKKEFSSKTIDEWKQNLYWRWLYVLLPLLEERTGENIPKFIQSSSWMDKELQTALASWTELRHDTILYGKQSYTGRTRNGGPEFTYGYVEPYPEVYGRIEEMMRDLRINLTNLGIVSEEISEKMKDFEYICSILKTISEKELNNQEISDEEYGTIWNIADKLIYIKTFPFEIIEKIASDTDSKIDIIADVHTDLNTKQVLEEGIGTPLNIYVLVNDSKGSRICRGAVYSYYEFKQPIEDRLTDEKWQEWGKSKLRPPQPEWIKVINQTQTQKPKMRN